MMKELEDQIANDVNNFLDAYYEGDYGTAVELDSERQYGYICVTFYGNDEFVLIAGFVKDMMEALDIKTPDISADWDGEAGKYELEIEESNGDLPRAREK